MMTDVFWLNGAFVEPQDACVSPLDRAFVMGDAVYEVVRIHHGRPFCAGAHFDRMKNGLDELGIPAPFDGEGFATILLELAARNGVQFGVAYLQVSRGAAPRSHLVPRGIEPTVFGFSNSPPIPTWKDYPDGVKAITLPDQRWARCDLKTTVGSTRKCCSTEHKQIIHDIAAEHIPDNKTSLPMPRRLDADSKLRHRGTDGDNRQAHQRLAPTKRYRPASGSLDDKPCSKLQHHHAESEADKVH